MHGNSMGNQYMWSTNSTYLGSMVTGAELQAWRKKREEAIARGEDPDAGLKKAMAEKREKKERGLFGRLKGKARNEEGWRALMRDEASVAGTETGYEASITTVGDERGNVVR